MLGRHELRLGYHRAETARHSSGAGAARRGIRVGDFGAAKAWYGRLLRAEPSFGPHATEAVWELAEHRSLFILENAEAAGRALHTVFVDDLDARVADISSRGLEPDELVTYPGKARKAIYRDADGNEIGFGGALA